MPVFVVFFFEGYGDHRDLHSFPTRRSSDLFGVSLGGLIPWANVGRVALAAAVSAAVLATTDRKSTRLNSSHPSISYAVFCLKKKKNKQCHHFSPHYKRVLMVESRIDCYDLL